MRTHHCRLGPLQGLRLLRGSKPKERRAVSESLLSIAIGVVCAALYGAILLFAIYAVEGEPPWDIVARQERDKERKDGP
jgi:hypothetical protein